jgi:SOS response regulatory protein OraA/RecX
VAAAGLVAGEPLTRARAAALARQRRRSRAAQTALRALARRDLAMAELNARLVRRGVGSADRRALVSSLADAGIVDDGRLAQMRAATLAERGHGDAAIVAALEQRGLDACHVAAAVAGLEAEAERARRVVDRRGLSPRTLRALTAKGFSEASLEPFVDALAHAGESR